MAYLRQYEGRAHGAAPALAPVLDVAGMHFEGPYYTTAALLDAPGVYVAVDVRRGRRGRVWHVCIDAGMSERVRLRVDAHDRAGCWSRKAKGSPAFAALYTDNAAFSRVLEEAVRALFGPLCGDLPR